MASGRRGGYRRRLTPVRGGIWAILAFVFLLRLPFLNQAIQGDDVYYLAAAQHAQIDPAHPNHARFLLLGDWVTMRGHPHPPLNGWVLGGLLALLGDIREVPFHAAYILFSLIAAAGMWSLARRFSPRPFEATLLFCVTLPFVVNGASLESDLPFLAFWIAGIALFIHATGLVASASHSLTLPSSRPLPSRDRQGAVWLLLAAAIALCLAAMTAFQAIVVVPILWLYLWQHNRKSKAAWIVTLSPVLMIAAWQLFERLTSEALPATVLAGYFQTYDLQSLTNKLRNAAALTGHAGWIVFPALTFAAFWNWPVAIAGMALGALIDWHPLFWISFGAGLCLVVAQLRALRSDVATQFMAAWIAIFFAAALVLFFAGSARYLLPISAPVAILVSRRLSSKWLLSGAGAQLAVGLCLASVNYQHWDAYRDFAKSLEPEIARNRAWTNAEWGLRYYLESYGALPLARGQAIQPGEMLVTSELAAPIPFTTAGGTLVPDRHIEVRTSIPFRLIGLDSKSAYSTAQAGFRPFDISAAPIDRVRVETVVERKPTLSYLPMNAPEAESQIASGVYRLDSEKDPWRWMGKRAVVLLKPPETPAPVRAVFHIPDQAPARKVTLSVNGKQVAERTYSGTGSFTLTSSKPVSASGDIAIVILTIDKTFSVPGDKRELGIILSEIGFR